MAKNAVVVVLGDDLYKSIEIMIVIQFVFLMLIYQANEHGRLDQRLLIFWR